MRSTNMLERLNQETKRRTHVERIFPNPARCLRPVRALAVETHEEWLGSPRYLNMKDGGMSAWVPTCPRLAMGSRPQERHATPRHGGGLMAVLDRSPAHCHRDFRPGRRNSDAQPNKETS
jgi:hypothetical protein